MNEFSSVDDVLDFAIAGEREAQEFYQGLADRATPADKTLFEDFVAEERMHEERLLEIKAGGKLLDAQAKVMDLKIGDYLVDVEATPDMSLQDALIVSMKKEKQAFRLYTDLAKATADSELKKTFLGLAQEEAKHKLFFELQYDERILTQN
ncbi:MAG: ferritin family protein [Deltaproteobacteria bacterium]|nr:ferritin family protein [Deltaproteobacteria bacterium]MBW2257464.1 ferritin family protein [Deltaproteobacteria bacterium]